MRNISFSLTTPQFIDDSKDVTRRLGWEFLKPGDRLMACEKCQGIQKGGLVRLGVIEIISVTREPLHRMTADPAYGRAEAIREGFPEMSGREFVGMFTSHMKCLPATVVTRIEFRKIDPTVIGMAAPV
jgi:hypothetical protein